MKTHNFVQGSPEWLAYRLDHDNASEAAAVLGLSKTTTRNELLHAKHTGLGKEFSSWVQRNVLDYGHEVEALVRPLVEAIIGEDLYPMTCSDGRLSASLDGLTIGEDIAFECKQWNAEISAQVAAGVMPEQHIPQCQQILMVTGAGKLIFAVGDGTPENLLTLDVYPDPAWFERIRAGWAQFAIDLAAYTPPVVVIEAVGRAPETLPALHIEVTGMVTASNIAEFKATALGAIKSVNRDLQTDQDFADNAKAIKWCADIESRVKAAKEHTLGQTATIDAVFRAMDEISAEARNVRLELEKLDKARKDAVRLEIVQAGRAALAEHVTALNARLGKPYMPAVNADFAGAIKGRRSIEGLHDAVDTLLANTKIEASATADRIHANLTTLRELASNHAFLFTDAAQIVLKAPDDLAALVKLRIAEHQAAEEKKAEELRERIRKEEQQKLVREQEAQAALARRLADSEKREQGRQAEIARAALQFHAAQESRAADEPDVQAFPALVDLPVDISPAAQPEPIQVVQVASFDRPAPADRGATLRLGEINACLAPIALTAEGLASLGFTPVATNKNAKLYRASDLQAIGAALMAHIASVCQLQAA